MAQIIINTNDGDILLRGASDCWEYCEQVKVKGETEWRAVKYFTSLGTALQTIGNRKVRLSDAKTLEELQKVIKEVRDEITRLYHDAFIIDTTLADANRTNTTGIWTQPRLPLDGAGAEGATENRADNHNEEPVKPSRKKVGGKP